MNLNAFKSVVTNIGRASLFYVEITGAPLGHLSPNILSFTAKVASLPGSKFAEIQVPFYGRKITFNGNREYDQLSLTCFATNGWQNYREIYNWHKNINHPSDNIAKSVYMEQFKCDIYMRLKDATGRDTMGYRIYGAWPINLGQVSLDWDSNNTADFSCDFAYDWHDIVQNPGIYQSNDRGLSGNSFG
jgi:hypothetical protein